LDFPRNTALASSGTSVSSLGIICSGGFRGLHRRAIVPLNADVSPPIALQKWKMLQT